MTPVYVIIVNSAVRVLLREHANANTGKSIVDGEEDVGSEFMEIVCERYA